MGISGTGYNWIRFGRLSIWKVPSLAMTRRPPKPVESAQLGFAIRWTGLEGDWLDVFKDVQVLFKLAQMLTAAWILSLHRTSQGCDKAQSRDDNLIQVISFENCI